MKINNELNDIIKKIHKEKTEIDDLLIKVVKRLKDASEIFQIINEKYSIVITVEIQNLIQNSNNEKEKLIK